MQRLSKHSFCAIFILLTFLLNACATKEAPLPDQTVPQEQLSPLEKYTKNSPIASSPPPGHVDAVADLPAELQAFFIKYLEIMLPDPLKISAVYLADTDQQFMEHGTATFPTYFSCVAYLQVPGEASPLDLEYFKAVKKQLQTIMLKPSYAKMVTESYPGLKESRISRFRQLESSDTHFAAMTEVSFPGDTQKMQCICTVMFVEGHIVIVYQYQEIFKKSDKQRFLKRYKQERDAMNIRLKAKE